MKTLGKLNINSKKLMKNEELITLKGGYGGCCCWCTTSQGSFGGCMAAGNPSDCRVNCILAGFTSSRWDC